MRANKENLDIRIVVQDIRKSETRWHTGCNDKYPDVRLTVVGKGQGLVKKHMGL